MNGVVPERLKGLSKEALVLPIGLVMAVIAAQVIVLLGAKGVVALLTLALAPLIVLNPLLVVLGSAFLVVFIPAGANAGEFFKLVVHVGDNKVNVLEILLLGSLLASSVKALRERLVTKERPGMGPFGWGILLFLLGHAGFLVAAILTGPGDLAFESFRPLLFYLYYFIFFFALSSRKERRYLLITLLAATATHAALSMLIGLYRDSLFAPIFRNTMWQDDVRVGFRNSYAYLLAIPVLVHALRHQMRHRSWVTVALFLSLAGFFLSLSRAVGIGLVLAYGLMALLMYQRSKKYRPRSPRHVVLVMLVVAMVVGASSLVGGKVVDRINSLSNLGSDPSFLTRINTTLYAYGLFMRDPVWGAGLDAALPTIAPDGSFYISPEGDVGEGIAIDDAYATVLAKTGIVGGVLLTGLWGTMILVAWRLRRAAKGLSANAWWQANLVLAVIPGTLVVAVVLSSHMLISYPTILLICALMAYSERERQDCRQIKGESI